MEECDSTWGSDSESDEPPAGEDDSGIFDPLGPPESERFPAEPGATSPQVQQRRVGEAGLQRAVGR